MTHTTLTDLPCIVEPKLTASVPYDPLSFPACFMSCSEEMLACLSTSTCTRVRVCHSSVHRQCKRGTKAVVKLRAGAVIQWGCCDLTAPLSSQVTLAIPFPSSCRPAAYYFIWLSLFSGGWRDIKTCQPQTCQNQFPFSITQFIVIF